MRSIVLEIFVFWISVPRARISHVVLVGSVDLVRVERKQVLMLLELIDLLKETLQRKIRSK